MAMGISQLVLFVKRLQLETIKVILVKDISVKSSQSYSFIRHRTCGVRGYMHELFVSKTRTSEVRASEGF